MKTSSANKTSNEGSWTLAYQKTSKTMFSSLRLKGKRSSFMSGFKSKLISLSSSNLSVTDILEVLEYQSNLDDGRIVNLRRLQAWSLLSLMVIPVEVEEAFIFRFSEAKKASNDF